MCVCVRARARACIRIDMIRLCRARPVVAEAFYNESLIRALGTVSTGDFVNDRSASVGVLIVPAVRCLH